LPTAILATGGTLAALDALRRRGGGCKEQRYLRLEARLAPFWTTLFATGLQKIELLATGLQMEFSNLATVGSAAGARKKKGTMPTLEEFAEQRKDTLMIETHKATVAYFDRLLLVNAGTLSLIVTVGGASLLTSQHPVTVDVWLRHRILIGCYLLASSVFLCLLHNYLKLPGMATSLLHLLDKGQKMGRWAKRIAYFCALVGIVAGLTTAAAYVLLVMALGALLTS
jgi:hypothetical protein